MQEVTTIEGDRRGRHRFGVLPSYPTLNFWTALQKRHENSGLRALHEDLQVAHKTVESWVQIFERLYAIHRLAPLTGPRIRALKKAREHYHYDWTLVKDGAARFENLVANHLLKWVHHEVDTTGRNLDLRYFRDKDGREVDFVVTEDEDPIHLVECKLGDRPVDKNLRYLA